MRVIAIRDSYFSDGKTLTDLAIHKGSVYHVTETYFKPGKHYFQDTGSYYPNGVGFYRLLEQTGLHVEDMFLELPDDDFEEGIQEEQIAIEEELTKLNK
jgi:hypothetical protein